MRLNEHCYHFSLKENMMSAENNKQVSIRYHELDSDPARWDEILTPDFVGRHTNGRTWNLDSHKQTWAKHTDLADSVHHQIAEGDFVATRFTRKGIFDGSPIEIDVMHLKRFVDGKIAEVWEYFDHSLLQR
jgi:ketosteroid isomerase-like protein